MHPLSHSLSLVSQPSFPSASADDLELSDALIHGLYRLGTRQAFGVNGANIEHFIDALQRSGGMVRSVMARTEDGAAYMADGYARVHRRLGVCYSTSGGGMVNLLAGIAESYSESVPVLAIVGQPPCELEGRGAFQDSCGRGRTVDARKMFESVAKFVAKVEDPKQFWSTFHQAAQAALGGRPGPAVLLLPRSMFEEEVGPMPQDFGPSRRACDEPDSCLIDRLVSELQGAKAPVMLIGHGVRRSTSPQSMIDFARRTNIPVATTMAARGDYPNDLQNYIGSVGVAGHPSAHAYIREAADFLLVVGSGLNVMTRAAFRSDPAALSRKRIAGINIDLGELRRAFDLDSHEPDPLGERGCLLSLEYDAGTVFNRLLERHDEQPFRFRPHGIQRTVFTPQLLTAAEEDEEAQEPEQSSPTLRQSEALRILCDFVPSGGHLVYDAGNCAAAALHYVRVPPKTSTTIALGMGAMGYGIAAAIGVSLGAAPPARTFVFTGDGSFMMKGLEIHTAVELQLPILWIVFNNSMHGMCMIRQRLLFESRFECVHYSSVDVAAVARGLGDPDSLWVGKASTPEQLVALLESYDGRGPGVLELCIDVEEMPPFAPFLGGEGGVMSVEDFEEGTLRRPARAIWKQR